jgi:glycogen debranching enzyme
MNDTSLIHQVAATSQHELSLNYVQGFGIVPSSDPHSNFYNQVWSRDLAHAAGNYYIKENPQAVFDSLKTIFKHQRPNGMLPFRVERQYLLLRIVPGLRFLAKPLFYVIERCLRGRRERPVYENQDFSGAEDTIPLILITIGLFWKHNPLGKKFTEEHFSDIERAISFFKTKIDSQDGLAVLKHHTADWADSIQRGGKLADINIWWAEGLNLFSVICKELGHVEKSARYAQEFDSLKGNIIKKYFRNGAYMSATDLDVRLDSVASVFGALFLLDAPEAQRVEQELSARVTTLSGLKNFDPRYGADAVLWPYKIIEHEEYHNGYVWPWVTCQNIFVKIKIGVGHPEEHVRAIYRNQALSDLSEMARLFHDAGGAYEIFYSDSCRPAISRWYKPPKNFMASLSGFQGAYLELQKLGWIQ